MPSRRILVLALALLIWTAAPARADATDKNALGYDIGGGLNIFLGYTVGVRGDVRHLHTLQDVTLGLFSNDRLDFWRANAGLTLRF